ncbi:hypothetical protein NDU88_005096 [Pleurodeles waltl]|uniref:Uncharacterized protein n=1 Tax=Pleurodeles waltl TaxID=8319 RepID=A0AAV7UH12_PLEWA|nr:hypothetical protein NDU88_005096 [Pleurodeles waltl]
MGSRDHAARPARSRKIRGPLLQRRRAPKCSTDRSGERERGGADPPSPLEERKGASAALCEGRPSPTATGLIAAGTRGDQRAQR